jgi:hypothetical protein
MDTVQNELPAVSAESLPDGTYVIKVGDALKGDIRKYLESCPFAETDSILEEMFPQNDSWWTQDGMTTVIKYLGTRPHKEVKPLISRMLAHGEVEVFQIQKTSETEV